MDGGADGGGKADLAARVAIMTTTHFTLATRRGSTIAEAVGRASMFLTAVSMSLVAMGFLAQATELGPAFFLAAHALLAVLLLVGVMTFDRVLQTSVEDGLLVRGEARVRRWYLQAAPDLEPWFVLPTGEDRATVLAAFAGTPGWQILLTAASMVGVVNAALAGALAGLAIRQGLGAGLGAVAAVGLAVAALAMAGQVIWQRRAWARAEAGAAS